MAEPWSPSTPEQVRERFAPFDVAWWIAGGLAIDLFLGWRTRPHEDIDIEMLRRDREVLFDVFDGWDLRAASDGDLVPWNRGDELADAVFGIWGRPDPTGPWAVEVILANGDDDTWRFRRDPEITLPMVEVVRTTASGMPYCTPEVQLLYKAKRARAKDDADLARCLHRLPAPSMDWLASAIARSEPAHPWIGVLANATRMGEGRR